MDYELIRQQIVARSTICLFRHVHPDGDAVGSQLGFAEFLKDNFPDKHIYCCGSEIFPKLAYLDLVDDATVKESLALILDTSDRERIDDQRALTASYTLKIDHHPIVDLYADYNYSDPTAGATAEIIADLIFSDTFKDCHVSIKTASYLYCALLTDTLAFKTTQTTAKTLMMAAKLAECGIDIYTLNEKMFAKSRKNFNFENYLRQLVQYSEGLAYCLLNRHDLAYNALNANEARTYVSEMGDVTEFKVWLLLSENPNGLYDGSVRSQRPYQINQIAQKYHGGGHKNAAAVKSLSLNEVNSLIADLKELIKNTKEEL